MNKKGITVEIYNAAETIRENKISIFFKFLELLSNFYIEENNITKENIERVIDWLDQNNLGTEPSLEYAPHNATIEVFYKENTSRLNTLEKLPLSALPSAHLDRSKLPILSKVDLTLNTVARKIIQNNEDAFLILEDEDGTPIGIIDTYSFAKFESLKNQYNDVTEITRPIYEIAQKTESLLDIIDKMIHSGKPYLIITNEDDKISGFSNLSNLLKEYYPLTKPYILLHKIENLVNDSIKLCGFTENDFLKIVRSDRRDFRNTGQALKLNDLTIGQKLELLISKKDILVKSHGNDITIFIGEINEKRQSFSKIRNRYCHFNNALHFNNEDTKQLSDFLLILNKFILYLSQTKPQNDSRTQAHS
jgi:hypothetical protein